MTVLIFNLPLRVRFTVNVIFTIMVLPLKSSFVIWLYILEISKQNIVSWWLSVFRENPDKLIFFYYSSAYHFSQSRIYNRPYFVNQLNFNDTETVAWRYSNKTIREISQNSQKSICVRLRHSLFPVNFTKIFLKHLRQTGSGSASDPFFKKVIKKLEQLHYVGWLYYVLKQKCPYILIN